MDKVRFAGMVLAAGYSSETGRLKPIVPINGKFAVRHIIDSFHSAGISKVFTVTGYGAEEIEPFVKDTVTVFDPDCGEGMMTSVKAGLTEALKYDWDGIMFTPADHALIRPYVIKLLMREFSPELHTVVFPAFDGRRGHPPLISRETARRLAELDVQGGAKSFPFSQGDTAADVEVGSPDIFANMNTPGDCENMKTLFARNAPTAKECELMLEAERTSGKVREHCRAVAEKAMMLAEDAEYAGYKLDKKLIFSAALLHDVKRAESNHAAAGAQVLKDNGFPFAARIVAEHADIPEGKTERICESSIVYLADKSVDGTEPVEPEERLARIAGRGKPELEEKLRKAIKIKNKIYG